MKRLRRVLSAIVLFACGCEVDRRTVDVSFGENLEGLTGFQCVQESVPGNPPLVARATGLPAVSLVVDLVELGDGIPSCRAPQIVSWCATRDCRPSPGRRVTEVLDLTGIAGSPNPQQAVLQLLADLDGKRIFDDVPSGKALILRVVGTIQPPAEVEATDASGRYVLFDTAGLLGVAYSCPVVLSAASGELFLGFDALDNRCETGVVVAAGVF